MGLGGTILASVGIFICVLVANGRWPNVWAAIIGGGGAVPPTTPFSGGGATNASGPPGGASGEWS
jgi:hypothetical protein